MKKPNVISKIKRHHLGDLVAFVPVHANHATAFVQEALPCAVGDRVCVHSDELELSGACFHLPEIHVRFRLLRLGRLKPVSLWN